MQRNWRSCLRKTESKQLGVENPAKAQVQRGCKQRDLQAHVSGATSLLQLAQVDLQRCLLLLRLLWSSLHF